jgi:hypothetical protein
MFESMTDEEIRAGVIEKRQQLARLEAEWLAMAAELDRRQAWAVDGSLSGGGWIARHCDMPASTAREKVRVARKLDRMPATSAAYYDGALGWAHVRALAAVVHQRTAEAFSRDEEMLLEQAGKLDAEGFARYVRRWEELVDQDGPPPRAFDRGRNAVQLSESFQGRWFGKLNLDAESGAIVNHGLATVMEELFERGDAAASLRSATERRAEALVELVRRGLASEKAARPLVLVRIDLDETQAKLGDGTWVRGEDARRLACDADVARVLTTGRSRVLDLGASTRTPSDAQRRALGTLYDTCAFPECDRPFRWCELHHIIHWIDDGPTDVENLIPLCSRHHHLHHNGTFRFRWEGDLLVVRDTNGIVIGDAAASPLLAA